MAEGEWLVATLRSLVVSAAAAFILTPLVRNMARRRGWVDRPDGHRKLHLTPVPRLGGVAVFAAFALTCALVPSSQLSAAAALHLLVACGAVMAIGVVDDIYDVRPAAKLAVQGLAALYLYLAGYEITALSNPLTGDSVELGMLSLPLTLVWFVGMSNAFNLIDGLDGLAAGVGLFSTTTLFIACAINERWDIAVIAAALGGALLGFLRYNFNPASVFLGDSGSLFIGFALAAIAVRGSMKSSAAIAVAAPLMALAVPILDASVALFRRLVRGDDPFRADGDHIHHRLLRMGLTPRRVVAVMYAVAAAFGTLSLLTMNSRSQVVGMVVLASSLLTWIGINHLGYAEFGEIQRALRYGVGNQRRVMGNNVYLASLTQRFSDAPGVEQLRAILAEAMIRLQFERMEILFEKEALSSGLAASLPGWEREAPVAATVPTATWRVPVVAQGRLVATVVLTRSLQDQAPFEPGYLLNAIQNGFGSRLACLASSEAALGGGEAAEAVSG